MERSPWWFRYGQVTPASVAVWTTLLAMLVIWIVTIRRFAAVWPFWDELSYLSYTVGAQPLTWELLWAHHNGHRILVPKLVYFGVMKVSGYQPTVLMYISAVCLALGAGCVIAALRRARGRMHLLDAVLIFAALAFSQYYNLLWAFQIWVTLTGALVLVAIALAVNIRSSADRRPIMLTGAVAALLPFFGGPGMGMAPGFFLWLLGTGLTYLVSGVDRQDRTFAACSLASGVIAAGAWSLAVYGLPPSSALQTIRDALQSWAAFSAFMSQVYGTTVEFFSTPFLPESMYKGWPFPYDGSTWGHLGLFLLVSVAVILSAAWIRRPRERLRVSAISACLLAFVMLTLVLYFSRGIYGPTAGVSARYSTVAMPLLVLAIVTYGLYAPRLLRITVLLTIATATLVLLYGPYGNLAKLGALARQERDSAVAFERELARPGGTTIEELAGHFSAPLFEPGDARQVPGFIQLMAEHRVGPFRAVPVIPPRVSTWNTSPFPLRADTAYGVRWDGRTAVKSSGVHGVIGMRLPEPIRLSALRLTFRVKSPSVGAANIFVSWHAPGTRRADSIHPIRWGYPISDSLVQTGTAYIFSTVDRLEIGLGGGFTEWELLGSERLEPIATTTPTPSSRR